MKTIKHLNILKPNPGLNQEGFKYFEFVCRGCTIREDRIWLWEGWQNSMIEDSLNRAIDNSYMTLEEEPENDYDPNAIQVVCRGEHFGTMGYVGKEFTLQIKDILAKCAKYRVDPVESVVYDKREVRLIMTYLES